MGEVTHPQTRAATMNALNKITWKSKGAIAAAASLLTDTFRKTMFFQRNIPENKLTSLRRRLSVMLTPGASERVD